MLTQILTSTIVLMLAASNLYAAGKITKEQIREIIRETDAAAVNRDTEKIGVYLGEGFFKYIEVTTEEIPLAIQLNKAQYLEMIDKGWDVVENYSYKRKDTVIYVARDGATAESNSTIIETIRVEGKDMVSKVREYALYELENGRPVITRIESLTLVGDTTPYHNEQ